MSKYNVDLMLAVREQITSHPETHRQVMWGRRTECGTTYCIAGWAAVLSGQKLLWEGYAGASTETWWLDDGRGNVLTTIESYAREALGLSDEEAGDLFAFDLPEPKALQRLDALIEKGKNQP
ncbi:hypothetical protein [Streptomyces formicae]|uniref:Uncharacterized protein n=1 Tax=Streptomyces formicae TaxID=1616117 RepID=A0ABY3WL85_9ACTN|nr:hypothetical protein [Streptomyces formicae]UNM12356.1 hypothetical protein J4032_13125 [Streptomyces formicae]